MDVVFWNIQRCGGETEREESDRKPPPGDFGSNAMQTLHSDLRKITDMKPDIIVLCEALKGLAGDLKEFLVENKYRLVEPNDKADYEGFSAYKSDTTLRYVLLDRWGKVKQAYLIAGGKWPRPALLADLGNNKFLIFLHATSGVRTTKPQLGQIIETIDECRNKFGAEPVAILGDLNVDLKAEDQFQKVVSRGFGTAGRRSSGDLNSNPGSRLFPGSGQGHGANPNSNPGFPSFAGPGQGHGANQTPGNFRGEREYQQPKLEKLLKDYMVFRTSKATHSTGSELDWALIYMAYTLGSRLVRWKDYFAKRIDPDEYRPGLESIKKSDHVPVVLTIPGL